MKNRIALLITLITTCICFSKSYSQQTTAHTEKHLTNIDFSDRQAVINTTKNFFIGDHTGDIKYKKLSMHEKGAYRFVNRDGGYQEYMFDLESNDADTSYVEELLSVEIFDRVAMVRLRLAESSGGHHYKVLTMHKTNNDWKITTITWGSEITH